MKLNPQDLRIDIYRAGNGNSAVRIVHIPTGIAGECEEDIWAHEQKEKALSNLTDNLLKHYGFEELTTEERDLRHKEREAFGLYET